MTQTAAFARNPFFSIENKATSDIGRSVVLFEIQSIESRLNSSSCLKDAPCRKKNFEIIWIKEGKGQVRADFEKHEIADNMLYCLSPGQLAHYMIEPGSKGYIISFRGDFLQLNESCKDGFARFEQSNNFLNISAIQIGEDVGREMDEIARQMVKEYAAGSALRLQILKALLNIFILYMPSASARTIQDVCQNRDKELVRKFMHLLKTNYKTLKRVGDYADALIVTPSYLNTIIKKVSGYTASQLIQQCIVMEAKRIALHTGDSMKEIAYSLGFDNLAHFSKFFKNSCGMSFTEFKRTHSGS